MEELFSVVLFFPNDTWHYEKRFIPAQEAVTLARNCTLRPAAKIGMISSIIITDGGDNCVFEWKFNQGVTFPKSEKHLDKTETQ